MKLIKNNLYILCIIGLIILDQLLKIFIPKNIEVIHGILNFSYIENTGGAFGIMESNIFLMIIFNFIILFSIGKFMIRHKERMSKLTKLGVIFLLGGGISNLIDRIFRGYVVDFIDFTPIINFPIFNFADIILTIGWIFFIIGTANFMIKNKGEINAI